MKNFRSFIGYLIAATIIPLVWGSLVNIAGISGGLVATLLLVAPIWYLNHHLNLVDNKSGVAFVDMGLAIAIGGIFRDTFLLGGSQLAASWLTIILVVVGGLAGGLASAVIEKIVANHKKVKTENCLNEKTLPILTKEG